MDDSPEKCQARPGEEITLDAENRQVCSECGQLLAEGDFGYDPSARLEYLRSQIEAECISQGEIAELADLANYINPEDTVLLEWAGVPEFGPEREAQAQAWAKR